MYCSQASIIRAPLISKKAVLSGLYKTGRHHGGHHGPTIIITCHYWCCYGGAEAGGLCVSYVVKAHRESLQAMARGGELGGEEARVIKYLGHELRGLRQMMMVEEAPFQQSWLSSDDSSGSDEESNVFQVSSIPSYMAMAE